MLLDSSTHCDELTFDAECSVAVHSVNAIEELMRDANTLPTNTSEELQLQILGQIRDNLQGINRKQDVIEGKISGISERVVRLEERDERIERLEKSSERTEAKVDALLKDKDQRDGASGVFVGLRGWLPVVFASVAALAAIFSAIYTLGRVTGKIEPPPGVLRDPNYQHRQQ